MPARSEVPSTTEIFFNKLPVPVQQSILRMRNNMGVVVGLLEIRDPNDIWYKGRKVVGIDAVPDSGAINRIVATHPGSGEIATSKTKPVSKKRKRTPTQYEDTKGEPTGSGEISLSKLPQEAQGYIHNLFRKTTMSMAVGGKLLEIGSDTVVYGGKIVLFEEEKKVISHKELPSWVKEALLRVKNSGQAVILMQNGQRLEARMDQGQVVATFNGQTIENLFEL